jgi:pectin methylesterase-like acyl-CoA thioesterase
MTLATYAQRTIIVEKGNVQSLLAAISEANHLNADSTAERLFILIPDGYYDLGETTLTRISGHNVAVIGQSMEGTIIRNQPDVKIESISKTAVFQNRGRNNYYQDLTLKNDLDYYAAVPDGRAVCLQDKGMRTICNRVRMLSYQDTYYSDNEKCQHYMQDTEIHGTIDFICGAGDVWFERCRIVTEKRTLGGDGVNIITAIASLVEGILYLVLLVYVINVRDQFGI